MLHHKFANRLYRAGEMLALGKHKMVSSVLFAKRCKHTDMLKNNIKIWYQARFVHLYCFLSNACRRQRICDSERHRCSLELVCSIRKERDGKEWLEILRTARMAAYSTQYRSCHALGFNSDCNIMCMQLTVLFRNCNFWFSNVQS